MRPSFSPGLMTTRCSSTCSSSAGSLRDDSAREILRLYHAEKWRLGTIAAQLAHEGVLIASMSSSSENDSLAALARPGLHPCAMGRKHVAFPSKGDKTAVGRQEGGSSGAFGTAAGGKGAEYGQDLGSRIAFGCPSEGA